MDPLFKEEYDAWRAQYDAGRAQRLKQLNNHVDNGGGGSVGSVGISGSGSGSGGGIGGAGSAVRSRDAEERSNEPSKRPRSCGGHNDDKGGGDGGTIAIPKGMISCKSTWVVRFSHDLGSLQIDEARSSSDRLLATGGAPFFLSKRGQSRVEENGDKTFL